MSTYLIAGTLLCAATAFSQISPDPRHLEEIAYDSKRNKIVLFGGGGNVIGKGLTFPDHLSEWDASIWKDFQLQGPGNRSGHALVYDAYERATLLIGGISQVQHVFSVKLDVWKWDGKAWSLYNTNAPVKSPEATYDPIDKRVLVYGDVFNKTQLKQNGDPDVFQLWELKYNRWKKLSADGPNPNSAYEIAYDMARNALVIPTWEKGKSIVWEWKNEKWDKTVARGEAPSERNRFSLAYHPEEKATYLFGGRNSANPFCNDFWKWNGRSWTKVESPQTPAIRAAATMEYGKGALYLYGGVVEWGLSNEIWQWQNGVWKLMNAQDAMDATRTLNRLEEWVSNHPDNGDAHQQYGDLLRNLKRNEAAEEVLKKAHALKPRDHNCLFSLLQVLYVLNKTTEAEIFLSNAISAGALESFGRLGTLLFSLNKNQQGIKCYEKAVQLQPNGDNYYNLACGYALSGQKDNAFNALNKAIENGFKDKGQFEGDTDLESLKADARWKALLEKLQ
ncbi:TPR end-of-group domain-containing protein [Haliscomenobacter hydrossis]|uniref:Tetratricopeptide TPR_1 repeat-containing protein n=1 Tax=Haliscomenobacter hydrossis (strain ATCC 27775 / DSM 1100 / LMG 10767 / O) TaxID=760192 RepID=F4L0W9_HALH1|nr:hypothetical protein [Haliscomenobacter hydrossis]AEE50573.1 Tetratricopeptide TPR_1 repeat-containing protein [Haliscomenobacter hydrossis DSM 1100]